jgi:Tol biopolymer transport system component
MNVFSGLLRLLRAQCLVTATAMFALLFPVTAGATGDPERFSPADLVAVREVSDPQVSPDGAWVAFVVETSDLDEDRATSDLWMVSWDGARTLQLTHTAKASESRPRWSPGNRFLAFLAGRECEDAKDQVWLIDRAGGEARQLTALPGGVTDFVWSPDGKRLALIASDPDPDEPVPCAGETVKKKTPAPIVIDRYQFKEDETGYLRHFRDHLYLFDLETGTAELLTPGDYDEFFPAWSPDGSRIAFVSKRDGDPDRNENSDVFVIAARPGAAPEQLTHFESADAAPYWAPRPGAPMARQSPICRGDPASIATTTRRPWRRFRRPAASPV